MRAAIAFPCTTDREAIRRCGRPARSPRDTLRWRSRIPVRRSLHRARNHPVRSAGRGRGGCKLPQRAPPWPAVPHRGHEWRYRHRRNAGRGGPAPWLRRPSRDRCEFPWRHRQPPDAPPVGEADPQLQKAVDVGDAAKGKPSELVLKGRCPSLRSRSRVISSAAPWSAASCKCTSAPNK